MVKSYEDFDKPYRRGLVLGLSLAELFLILIFLLLLVAMGAVQNLEERFQEAEEEKHELQEEKQKIEEKNQKLEDSLDAVYKFIGTEITIVDFTRLVKEAGEQQKVVRENRELSDQLVDVREKLNEVDEVAEILENNDIQPEDIEKVLQDKALVDSQREENRMLSEQLVETQEKLNQVNEIIKALEKNSLDPEDIQMVFENKALAERQSEENEILSEQLADAQEKLDKVGEISKALEDNDLEPKDVEQVLENKALAEGLRDENRELSEQLAEAREKIDKTDEIAKALDEQGIGPEDVEQVIENKKLTESLRGENKELSEQLTETQEKLDKVSEIAETLENNNLEPEDIEKAYENKELAEGLREENKELSEQLAETQEKLDKISEIAETLENNNLEPEDIEKAYENKELAEGLREENKELSEQLTETQEQLDKAGEILKALKDNDLEPEDVEKVLENKALAESLGEEKRELSEQLAEAQDKIDKVGEIVKALEDNDLKPKDIEKVFENKALAESLREEVDALSEQLAETQDKFDKTGEIAEALENNDIQPEDIEKAYENKVLAESRLRKNKELSEQLAEAREKLDKAGEIAKTLEDNDLEPRDIEKVLENKALIERQREENRKLSEQLVKVQEKLDKVDDITKALENNDIKPEDVKKVFDENNELSDQLEKAQEKLNDVDEIAKALGNNDIKLEDVEKLLEDKQFFERRLEEAEEEIVKRDQVINKYAKKGQSPPCWFVNVPDADEIDGIRQRHVKIFDVKITDTDFEVRWHDNSGIESDIDRGNKNSLPYVNTVFMNKSLSAEEFTNVFSKFNDAGEERLIQSYKCRFMVDVFDATSPNNKTGYKHNLGIVENLFYKYEEGGSW